MVVAALQQPLPHRIGNGWVPYGVRSGPGEDNIQHHPQPAAEGQPVPKAFFPAASGHPLRQRPTGARWTA
eukprot:scaffold632455_cov29-Prasinocladus_malaysianus.AAC.2